MRLSFLIVFAASTALQVRGHVASVLNATWPQLCTASEPESRCPDGATCCAALFSGSGQGCCPWVDAVCCANKITCCPSGTKCVDTVPTDWPHWAVVTSCEPVGSKPASDSIQGKAVCKYGPPLPASPSLKNVLVIGDSVSIGYTPFVADLLKEEALVQHAPWGGDGGAEETAYGVQCLDYFLAHPTGETFVADVVLFNWGLHDGPQLFTFPPANVTVPGQEGNMAVYASQLVNITARLQTYANVTGAKLLFAITSPMMADLVADQDVSELNRRAVGVMEAAGVPMVDLHAAVVGKCGSVPQSSCFGADDCFSPHCGPDGYEWLANSTIAPAIQKLYAK